MKTLLLCLLVMGTSTLITCEGQGIDPGDVGKIRAEFRLGVGGGIENHSVCQTNSGTTVNISVGGGLGVGAKLGYRICEPFEISSEFLYQASVLDQPVTNASGNFHRFVVTPTAKYLLFLKKDVRRISINIGAGWGIYSAAKLDIDGSKIAGGAHNIYEYANSSGPHGCAEFELCTKKKISFIGGLKYYRVEYDLKKVTSDGITIPLNIIPASALKDILTIDGSGLDLYAGISYLF